MTRATKPLSVLGMIALCLSGRVLADEVKVPRYHFDVGQEITYRGTTESRYRYQVSGKDRDGSYTTEEEWTLWVVRRNDDGGERLVLRSDITTTYPGQGAGRSSSATKSHLGYCDISADGRLIPNRTVGFFLDPLRLLPRLPEDADASRHGWSESVAWDGSTERFKPLPDQPDDSSPWSFEGRREGPMDRVAGATGKSVFEFDPKGGLIRRVETESTRSYGIASKTTGTWELAAVRTHDPEWTRRFADEASAFFEATRAYWTLCDRAATDKTLLPKAEGVLKEARDRISLPVLRQELDRLAGEHRDLARSTAQQADRWAPILGKPAPDWEAKDLDGQPHSLCDYRGKVVLLDFWGRGCGWCIRSMPQLKALAEDFRGQPVALLGMSLDADEKDARYVVEQMGIGYPVLRSEKVDGKYLVGGIPHLAIIDREGKLVGIHLGYTPTLREEVAKDVRRLLGAE